MTEREQQLLRWIAEDPQISQQELAERAGIARSSVAVHISNLMKKGYITGRGYVVAAPRAAAVVGGVNIDIGGVSAAPLVAADSNPGTVQTSLGGVGRNIAHDLALLGVKPHLLTALGDDDNAARVAASCAALGIDLSHALRVPGAATSTYLYIADSDGEMALALSDMAVYDRLTPAWLAAQAPLLQSVQAVVADANLPAATLAALAEVSKAPIFADPVSAAKAGRLRPILSRLHTLKPNRLEAELLSGVAINDETSLYAAADALLGTGLQRVFISLGAHGVLAAEGAQRLLLPCMPGPVVNTTGCGDAFMAALVWAYLRGENLESSARAGLAAAAIAAESAETINPALRETALLACLAETV